MSKWLKRAILGAIVVVVVVVGLVNMPFFTEWMYDGARTGVDQDLQHAQRLIKETELVCQGIGRQSEHCQLAVEEFRKVIDRYDGHLVFIMILIQYRAIPENQITLSWHREKTAEGLSLRMRLTKL
jgi:hypothetical protein